MPSHCSPAQILCHNATVYFVNFCVLISCVVLMLDVLSLDKHTTKHRVLRNLDAATTAVFGVEVSLRF